MIKARQTEVKRQPLNLALVFDRSGSMKIENKIGYVQRAGHLVTDNLTRKDHLAMVAYSDRVQILVPMHPVVNRQYLHHRIDELFADGNTNLSGGLLEGFAQVYKRRGKPGLHHVIVLTDGLANRGVTGVTQLSNLVASYTARGITVSAIGVGDKYNEQLMAAIARAGRGRYTYVADPEDIPGAFDRELGSLLAVTAQNARMKMSIPKNVTLEKIFDREMPAQKTSLDLPLGDLSSGEERLVLMKFRVNQRAAGDLLHFHPKLIYDDVPAVARVEEEQEAHIDLLEDGQEPSDVDQALMAYAQLVEGVDLIGMAVESMDVKLAQRVQNFHRTKYPALKKSAVASRQQAFVNQAFMFEHFARELNSLIEHGALHQHSDARNRLQKDFHYRKYLMEHHRQPHHYHH